MPTPTWNLEWLSHNSQRRYPLAVDSGGRDVTASFAIPNDFIVELDLPIHGGLDVDPTRFFIKHIGAYATGYSVVVGYQPTTGDAVDVATALIERSTHTRNQYYALGGIGDFYDTFGKITIGRLDAIDQQPQGFFEFDLEETRLDTDAVRPIIRGVSSIRVVNGEDVSERLYGDIELVPGANMQIVPVIVNGQDPKLIFSAIDGEGTIEECVCEGDADTPCIERINGVPPTPAGDFTLLGNECLQISEIQNGLKLEDVCSEPCCGCEELEAITRDLERFGSNATTLENFLVSLEARVTQMDMVVLGSKLNDRGCVQCE